METLHEMNFNFNTVSNSIKTIGTLIIITIGFVMVMEDLNIINF